MKPEDLIKAAQEFKEIYRKEFSTELSDKEAEARTIEFLQLFSCLTAQE